MATAGSETTTGRDALMHVYLDAWNSHDPAAVAAFFAPDGVYDDRGAGSVLRGTDEIREHVVSVLAAFSDLRFELVRAAHGADFTAAEWRASMTHTGELEGLKASGRSVTSAGVDVATLDAEGRIARLVSYYDGAQIMRDLGLLPGRGSRLERALLRVASLRPRRS
jgi:steroid delta-isomerase-like uncharacterized protein